MRVDTDTAKAVVRLFVEPRYAELFNEYNEIRQKVFAQTGEFEFIYAQELWDSDSITFPYQRKRGGVGASLPKNLRPRFIEWRREWLAFVNETNMIRQVVQSLYSALPSTLQFYQALPEFLINPYLDTQTYTTPTTGKSMNMSSFRTKPSMFIDPALSEEDKKLKMEELKKIWPEHLIRAFNSIVPTLSFYAVKRLMQ